MTRAISVRHESWPLARPFAIARGVKTAAEVVVVEIAEDGVIGRGECVPYPRYGETPASVMAAIHAIVPRLAEGLDREGLASRLPAGAARNAIDCALWDLAAKRSGEPAWRRAGLPEPRPVITAETIGIAAPAEMAAAAARLANRPLLKVKLNREAIAARVSAVRAVAPAAELVVDANESWDLPTLRAVAPALADLGVTLIEQPLPAAQDHLLKDFRSPVPLCADESFHVADDLPTLPDAYALVNVKLDKTGGLTHALRALTAARAQGRAIMVGCMIATSLAIAPALLLAPAARVVDLDGPVWLDHDRVPGLAIRDDLILPAPSALWG